MSTNFPTSLDTLQNPTSTDTVASVDHAAQHTNANDAIEALQAKVGIDSSAVSTSHDYKIARKAEKTDPVLDGTPTGTALASAATASKIVTRDSNANIFGNNVVSSLATTATAAGTTTLTAASAQVQYFTGSSTQTVALPAGNTLSTGHQFYIYNASSGAVTVQNSAGSTQFVLAGGTTGLFTLAAASSPGTWLADPYPFAIASAKKVTWLNTMTFSAPDSSTIAMFKETDNGNSGTSKTITWTSSISQKLTLTGDCTLTFTAPDGPCTLTLKLIQDGTGTRLVTWPAAVHWSGGTAPTLTTTASKVDIIQFYYDGSTYFGRSNLNYTA